MKALWTVAGIYRLQNCKELCMTDSSQISDDRDNNNNEMNSHCDSTQIKLIADQLYWLARVDHHRKSYRWQYPVYQTAMQPLPGIRLGVVFMPCGRVAESVQIW